ncbi:hypothetical protein DPMN_009363 [Dreissena polymorpha]|uniref:Uncharacterized protein n=1 Tax=Dreissena polymorpha TaxID=45954 RepID=A0A9D4N057_DREPO|nr:hypothetical protein DPMN_009363 [Dreissena polymorpha]
MPASARGSDNIPPTYLPASTIKLDLFKKYTMQCTSEHRVIKVTAFMWSKCIPHIRIASSRDVCATYENKRKRVVGALEE